MILKLINTKIKYKLFIVNSLFLIFAFFCNPYRSCRKFFKGKDLDYLGVYGETSFKQWMELAEALDLSSEDVFLELGSGRGKGCFWLAEVFGCQSIGVEWNPIFVGWGKLMAKLMGSKVRFLQGNLLEMDLPFANRVYLYGTCFRDEEIKLLAQKFFCFPKGTKIITISYSLQEYDSRFCVEKIMDVDFLWGKTQAYFNKVKDHG